MRTSVSGLVILLGILVAVPGLSAQQPSDGAHAAPPWAVDEALQQHLSAVEADRSVVERLLARPDVQAIAGQIGLDIRRAQAAVATLEGEQLSELASRARQAEQSLAGGQSRITISTTLIIIALLVLILLIVAID